MSHVLASIATSLHLAAGFGLVGAVLVVMAKVERMRPRRRVRAASVRSNGWRR